MRSIGPMRHMALMAGVILLSIGTTVALTPAYAAGGGGGGGGGGAGGGGGGSGGGGSGGGGSGGGGSGRGGGGSAGNWSGSGLITCAKGQIYSQKKRKCVQMKGEIRIPSDKEMKKIDGEIEQLFEESGIFPAEKSRPGQG